MKVFISWSGERSRLIAEELKIWLKDVIQILEPFMSQHDIQKGSIWTEELDKELKSDSIALIVLTSDNIESPWINYEAGAIHKGINGNKIATLLVDIDYSQLPSTLSKFNGTKFEKGEIHSLLKSINKELGKSSLDEAVLLRSFNSHWNRLESKYQESKSHAKYKKDQLSIVESNIHRTIGKQFNLSTNFHDDISEIVELLIGSKKKEEIERNFQEWLKDNDKDELSPINSNIMKEILYWVCLFDSPFKIDIFRMIKEYSKNKQDEIEDITNQGIAAHTG